MLCTSTFSPLHIDSRRTLGGGPVGPGDRLGLTDRALALRSCTEGGRILRAQRPITVLDVARSGALGETSGKGSHTLWSSFSTFEIHGGSKPSTGSAIHYIFFTDSTGPLVLYPKDLLQPCSSTALGLKRGCTDMDMGLAEGASSYIAATITETGGAWPPTTQTLAEVTPKQPLKLQPPSATANGAVSFSYVVLAPTLAGTPWVIFGELDKVVPASPNRFGSLAASGSGLTWELSGESEEEVHISYAQVGKLGEGLKSVTCVLKNQQNQQPTRAGPGAATLSCKLPTGCTCA
jgi:hypothetical protein